MNQENADGQKRAAHQKQLRQKPFAWSRKRYRRLYQSQEQREIAGIRHVNVGVDFCAAILEQAADADESLLDRFRVLRGYGFGCGEQSFSRLSAILVQHKDGEYFAKDHAAGDESDSPKHEQALRAHGGKPCDHRR